MDLSGPRARFTHNKVFFLENNFAAFAVVNNVAIVHIGFEVLKIGCRIKAHCNPAIRPVTADVMSADRYSFDCLIEALTDATK